MFRRIGSPGVHGVGGIGVADIGAGCPAAPAPTGWWLSGGIAAANCLAAYTPKGAANIAASYDNNAAPGNGLPDGTYDAALGVAPAWAALTGWTDAGASASFLHTGIVPAVTYSMVIRYVGTPYLALTGSSGTGVLWDTGFSLLGNFAGSGFHRFVNGAQNGQNAWGEITATYCVAGKDYYFDGVWGGAIGAGAPTGGDIHLLSVNGLAVWTTCYLESCAIYSVTITAAQALALHTAMIAL